MRFVPDRHYILYPVVNTVVFHVLSSHVILHYLMSSHISSIVSCHMWCIFYSMSYHIIHLKSFHVISYLIKSLVLSHHSVIYCHVLSHDVMIVLKYSITSYFRAQSHIFITLHRIFLNRVEAQTSIICNASRWREPVLQCKQSQLPESDTAENKSNKSRNADCWLILTPFSLLVFLFSPVAINLDMRNMILEMNFCSCSVQKYLSLL